MKMSNKTMYFLFITVLFLSCFNNSYHSRPERSLALIEFLNGSTVSYAINNPKMAVFPNENIILVTSTNTNISDYYIYSTAGSLVYKKASYCTTCDYMSVAVSSSSYVIVTFLTAGTVQIESFNFTNTSQNLKTFSISNVRWTSIDSFANGSFVVCITSTTLISFAILDTSLVGSLNSKTFPANTSSRAIVSSLSNGNFVLAANNSGVMFAIFSSGTQVGTNMYANTLANSTQKNCFVKGLSNGNFVIVWDNQFTSSIGVYGRIYSNDGTPLTNMEFKVNSFVDYNEIHFPVVSETVSGAFVVAWTNTVYPNTSRDIFYKEWDSSGNAITQESIATLDINGNQNTPYLIYHPTQRFIIGYVSRVNGYINLYSDVRVSPTCNNFDVVARPGTNLNIDFTDYINSNQDGVSLLKIRLKSLPSDGILKNKDDNSNLVVGNDYNFDKLYFVAGTITPVTFDYIVIDRKGNLSDKCTVRTYTCYSKCLTCNQIGNDSNHMCISCIYLHNLSDQNCVYANLPGDNSYTDMSVVPNMTYSCISNCKTCSSQTSCDICHGGYFRKTDNSCGVDCGGENFYINLNNVCNACSSNCRICASNKCVYCQTNFYLNPISDTCSTTCPSNYYKNLTTLQCEKCSFFCTSCTYENTCTTCDTNYYLHLVDNKCYSECPGGYIKNSTTKKCEACSSNCKSCTSATVCTSCFTNYFLYSVDKQCYSQCPTGFYGDSSTGTCKSCPLNCSTCTNGTICTVCNATYFLHSVDKLCYKPCPTNFFGNISNNNCEACPANCVQCTDSQTCTTCSTNYFVHYLVDNKCYSPCPFEYYGDAATKKCEACVPNCKNCTTGSQCTVCNTSYYLYPLDNKCYSNCPDQYFGDNDGICKICSPNCKQCFNADKCLICMPSYFLHLNDNKCYNTCPVSYFGNTSNNQCGLCPPNCLGCTDANTCTTCATSHFLHNLVDNKCYSVCPNEYFGNTTTKKCERCISNCKTCPNNTVCSSCNNNWYLLDSDKKCYSPCPFEFYGDTNDGNCKNCPSNCKTCTDVNICNLCNSDYFLHLFVDNLCYKPCPESFFNDSSTNPVQCSSCPDNCLQCVNGTQCTQCGNNYYLHNKVDNLCYQECPYEYYKNFDTKNCDQCSQNCKKCVDNNTCTTCNTNYFLFSDKKCYSSCPDGYFEKVSSGTCEKCPNDCKKCSDGYNCITCNGNYFLHLLDNLCYNSCPPKFYSNSITSQCQSCSSNCLSCTNESICTKCALGFYLNYLIDHKCYEICQDEYYGNTVDGTCEKCSQNCKNCKDSNTCLECNYNYFSLDGLCYSDCPNSYFKDIRTKQCLSCSTSCVRCVSRTECLSCGPGFFLIDTSKTCTDRCPFGSIASFDTGKCEGCPKNCIACVSPTECSTCGDGYYLHPIDKMCKNPCPQGYYGSDNFKKCELCGHNCIKCENGTECQECKVGYYLSLDDKICLESCPNTYYGNREKKICSNCPNNCFKCESGNECIFCESEYFLFLQTKQCYKFCPEGYYPNTSTSQCSQCNEICKTCFGPKETNCIECIFPKTKIGDKCLVSCQGQEIYDKSTDSCVAIDKLISSIAINAPDEVDLDKILSFEVSIIIERNKLFLNNPIKINIKWNQIYGGELRNENKTLTVNTENLVQGIYTFAADIFILDNPIKSITKEVNLRIFNLIPKVRNITELVMEQPIILDASQSYDEKGVVNEETEPEETMKFGWLCPGSLERKCSDFETEILMLNYEDYNEFVEENGSIFVITLLLSRGNKRSSLDFEVKLFPKKQIIDDNFWYISQKTKGVLNEDIIFEVVLMKTSDDYKLGNFSYLWTIPGFSATNYLNTRKEASLRVRFKDLNGLFDTVRVEITNKSTNQKYSKSFQYQYVYINKGRCKVEPTIGLSGDTQFKFTASNWNLSNQPLKYALYYQNDFNINFLIGRFFDTSYTTMIPYGTKYYIEVTDSVGYVALAECNVIIKRNSNLDLRGKFMTVEGKFLENEIYYSNNKDQYPTGYKNFDYELSYNFINSLFINNQELIIKSNMDRIISYINILNFCEKELETSSKIENLNNLLEKISTRINIVAKNLDLINIFANVLDQNFERYSKSEEKIQEMNIVNQNGIIWKNIIDSVYPTLISGQDIAFVTKYSRVTISKISRINLQSIKLITKFEDGKNIFRIDSKYVQSNSTNISSDSNKMKDCTFSIDADVCIEKNEISSKLDYYNTQEIGIFIKGDDLPIVPNQSNEVYPFSLNSIKVSIIEEPSRRRLSEGNSTVAENVPIYLKYQTILNLDPDMGTKTFQDKIRESTCVVYDNNLKVNATACRSWYDYTAKVVLCDCSVPGLVANLHNINLTDISKDAQFPKKYNSIFNNYVITIWFILIIIVSLLYLIGSILDKIQGYTKKYKANKYYDLGQSLIIEFTKFGFHKSYGLFKLIIYMVKMTHPLFSIFFIYSPIYGRGLRIFDLYILIKLSFLLSLFPYYLTDNSDYEDVKDKRKVSDMDKGPGDLEIAIKKMVIGFLYSIIGEIISKLIIRFLNSLHYQNILEYESNKKYKYMVKTLKKTYRDDIFEVYNYKMRKAYIKIKVLVKIKHLLENIIDKRNKSRMIRNPNPRSLSLLQKYRKAKSENRDELRSEIRTLVNNQLFEINHNKMKRSIDVNEIMLAQPYYDVSELNGLTLNMSNMFGQESVMVKTQRFTIFRENLSRRGGKKRINQFNQSKFGYSIGANKNRKFIEFTALQIMDKEMFNKDYREIKRRASLKAKLLALVFIFSYIFIVIMVTNVYNKYESNILKICIYPLISVVITDYIITQTAMIFVHSFFMYNFGEKYYTDNRINCNPISLVFKYVIPAISKENHKALLTFLKFHNRRLMAQ